MTKAKEVWPEFSWRNRKAQGESQSKTLGDKVLNCISEEGSSKSLEQKTKTILLPLLKAKKEVWKGSYKGWSEEGLTFRVRADLGCLHRKKWWRHPMTSGFILCNKSYLIFKAASVKYHLHFSYKSRTSEWDEIGRGSRLLKRRRFSSLVQRTETPERYTLTPFSPLPLH